MIVYQARPFFRDRSDAGRRLAENLAPYQGSDVTVLAIPRGGVPVAVEVAGSLGSGLDILVVRKIPIPYNPEAGYGAVTEDGAIVLNEPLVAQLGLVEEDIRLQAEEVRAEIERRGALYRNGLPPAVLEGKTAIIVDDGLASGFTMLAAVESARQRRAARIVVAVPVASRSASDVVRPVVDGLVSLITARMYAFAVASFYYRWYDLKDEEVVAYLEGWRRRWPAPMESGLQGKGIVEVDT